MIKETLYKITGLCLLSLFFFSCEKNVKDGYRIDYNESTAQLTVTTSDTTGAVGDTIVFSIQAESDFDIKSIVITGSPSGSSSSGFVIPSGSTDPLIDHIFGTIQKNTKAFQITYNYIVTQDTADPVVTFKLIDESGQKVVKKTIATLYSIAHYNSVILFTHSSSQADGFSTVDSAKYRDLSQYATTSTAHNAIQESTDIIFVVTNSDTAWLVAPYDGKFSTTNNAFIKNKTRFKLLTDVTSSGFDNIKSASLSAIIKRDSIKQNGTTNIAVKTGSIVGFFTDYNSSNSYKAGMLRVIAIHPSYCSWYTGTTYQIEMDIITQIPD
jgi:hypothetical protein